MTLWKQNKNYMEIIKLKKLPHLFIIKINRQLKVFLACIKICQHIHKGGKEYGYQYKRNFILYSRITHNYHNDN